MSMYERRFQSDGTPAVGNDYYISSRDTSETSSVAVDNEVIVENRVPSSAALCNASNMATLCNIGNTCYLNSVVYTLRFAPHFLHNLHHLIVDLESIQKIFVKHRSKSASLGRNCIEMHVQNTRSWSNKDLASLASYNGTAVIASEIYTHKSSQQLVTEKLHDVYQNLHCNEISETTKPFHADTFLNAIQDVSAIFEGNQQQDAHEFLMCVLNSIRETCQTLINAISDCPDVIENGCGNAEDHFKSTNSYLIDKVNLSARISNNSHDEITNNPSSLGTTNIMKASFFSRKSKRKEDTKTSKKIYVQTSFNERAQQTGSNSLFYLNSVDLSESAKRSAKINILPSILSKSQPKSETDEEQIGHQKLADKIKKLGLDFFSKDFEGVTVSTTKCLSCETITEQKQSMIDIAVPVPMSGYDNSDYGEKYNFFIQNSCITREYFRGENKYRCEQCTGYTEAIRSISYDVLPRLLIIQLSRFSGGMEKINSYIPTPFTLQCFCAKCYELGDSNSLHVYKLYSVITHVGATMSVGHYIAYTCPLDIENEYSNCPKDKRRNHAANTLHISDLTAVNNESSGTTSSSSSSGTGLMKKMKFGRSRVSGSIDTSKGIKNINSVSSKVITNGIEKLNMNTTCRSTRCCATAFKRNNFISTSKNINYRYSSVDFECGSDMKKKDITGVGSNEKDDTNTQSTTMDGFTKNTIYNENTESNAQIESLHVEPIWYMCDDEKIKAMTQSEFQELLSPSRKITITPYLLFYARIDLQKPLSPKLH